MNEINVSSLIDRVIKIAKLNCDDELLKWASLEAFGYHTSNKFMDDEVVVPKYRELAVEHRDMYERPLVFTHPDMKDINTTRIRHSVLELEGLSNQDTMLKSTDAGVINIIQKYFNVQASHYVFHSGVIATILYFIKNEALDRVIKYISEEEIMSEPFNIMNKDVETTDDSIFVSYSFNKKDKELVNGLIELLNSSGFKTITGEKNPIGPISKSIINKIKSSERFLVVMTKKDEKKNGKFTTSSWLLEEKGIAIAFDKPCIMLVEEGIDSNDIGGMQGDDQRLHFTRNNFSSKVADAIKMLKGEYK